MHATNQFRTFGSNANVMRNSLSRYRKTHYYIWCCHCISFCSVITCVKQGENNFRCYYWLKKDWHRLCGSSGRSWVNSNHCSVSRHSHISNQFLRLFVFISTKKKKLTIGLHMTNFVILKYFVEFPESSKQLKGRKAKRFCLKEKLPDQKRKCTNIDEFFWMWQL